MTSTDFGLDQLRDHGGQGAKPWSAFVPWVQGGLGWAGCGPGGGNLAPGPLGSVAGGPDRRRGWLLCLSPVPAAGGHAKPGYALGNKSPAGRGVRSAGGCQDVGAGPRPPPAGAGPQLGPKTEDRSPG
jgi:hypothetical protein